MTPTSPDQADFPAQQRALPFVERPWLLLLSVALALGIAGHLLWRADGHGDAHAVIDFTVALYLAVGVLLAPMLAQRAARRAIRRLSRLQRTALLARLMATSVLGPVGTVFIWLIVFDGAQLGRRVGHFALVVPQVELLCGCAALIGLSGAVGLLWRYRLADN